jgi:DNA-binding CsgD family transcriptional regulator
VRTADSKQVTVEEGREARDFGGTSGEFQKTESVRCVDARLGALISASHRATFRAELFQVFAAGVASGLSADLTQVLEYEPDRGDLLLRAGHGFCNELYDRVRVPSGLLSQAGRALLDPMGQPVELRDFSGPHDWTDDELLREHGARSGIVVKVRSGPRDFGTLGVFYLVPKSFVPEEVRFLALAATLLGSELERLRNEREAIAWRSRAELLHTGAALLKIPAERDEILSAAALAVVSGGVGGSRPVADWCFADALEGDGSLPKLRRVAVDHAEGVAERLQDAFSAPLAPTSPHGAPRAYATRQAELVERPGSAFISGVARNPEHRRALEEARLYSYVCAPVIGRERFHGALGFLRTETGTPVSYEVEDRDACSEFAALVGEAIERGASRPAPEEEKDAVRPRLSRLDLGLTDREHDVIAGIAAGHRLTRIGHELSISTNTVRTHKRHLCQKLGLSPKSADTEIVAEARRRGISDLPT